ncbi:asparagine synthase (glutamine-hydrolyzing) [bacterium]|nr:asparagine synthase (glutamine-hydrolyzing) [bacterium]
MCGIGGILGTDPRFSLESLVAALRHRGPDGEGSWSAEGCQLVHTRLAILDPNPSGAQPMLLEQLADGALVARSSEASGLGGTLVAALSFNGEIYNRDELRDELLRGGAKLVGTSDTEVLLHHLYTAGRTLLPRLAGMFALCFWRPQDRTGLIAVDRFGIKPLFYAKGADGAVMFASEARALDRLLGDPSLDPASVRDFLMWGSVPAPAALVSGLHQLLPGECLEYEDGHARRMRWSDDARGATSGVGRSTSPAPLLGDALEETVERHLLSDVPVGIFLSGGIDSTAVLAVARRVLGRSAEIHTFSMGSSSPELDESSLARRTAEHFGTEHHEWIIGLEEAQEEFRGYSAALDLPTIDGFNTWCVSRFVRTEGFKVALSGLGGDELFGGYPSFQLHPAIMRLHRRLGPARRVAGAALRLAPRASRWRRLGESLGRGSSPLSAYHAVRGVFTESEARELTLRLTGVDPGPADWELGALEAESGEQLVSDLEVSRYMASQLLRDTDVFSMRHGLEVRVPLVDTRFIDAVDAVDPRDRFRPGKQALVDAARDIPDWVIEHPKMGFRFPLEDWVDELLDREALGALDEAGVTSGPWYRKWAFALLQPWSTRGGRE